MVQTLPQLQKFKLKSRTWRAFSDGFPVGVCTSCSQLVDVDIFGGQLGAVPHELGRLTMLTRLALPDAGVTRLPESVSRLSALQELDLSAGFSEETNLPVGLAACQQLSRPTVDWFFDSPVLKELKALRYLDVLVHRDQPAYWTQLTALTELKLRSFGPIPPGLSGMTGPRKLFFVWGKFPYQDVQRDLPAGPYLSRLQSLVMEDCSFSSGVPARLAAAEQLHQLIIMEYNENLSKALQLTAADVAVLSALPELTTLRIDKPRRVDQEAWEERLAQLRAACIAQGRAAPQMLGA